MSQSSQLGAQLGFPLGFTNAPPEKTATGRASCSGFAIVAISVVALGLVHASGGMPLGKGQAACSGSVSATVSAASVRLTQISAEVIQELSTNAKIRVTQISAEVVLELQQTPVGGMVRATGAAAPALSVVAQGMVRSAGKSSALQTQYATAQSLTTARGQTYANVRSIGGFGLARTSGFVSAVGVSLGITGRARATGSIGVPTVLAFANVAGQSRCSGAVSQVQLSARAQGRVAALGMATVPIPASNVGCLTGHDAASTATAPNAVY